MLEYFVHRSFEGPGSFVCSSFLHREQEFQVVLVQGLRIQGGVAKRDRIELALRIVRLLLAIVSHDGARHLRYVAIVGERARGVLSAQGSQSRLIDLRLHVLDQHEMAVAEWQVV